MIRIITGCTPVGFISLKISTRLVIPHSKAHTIQSEKTRPHLKTFAYLQSNEKNYIFLFSTQVGKFGSLSRQRDAQTVMKMLASE